ncbi:MAG: ester cyclase [Solirubrobacterales bacterium]
MATAAKDTKTARKKGAKTIAREYFEAIANQDLAKASSMWKPGGKGYLHGLAELEAPGGWRAYFENLFGAFPDLELKAVEIAASGNNAGVRWRATGTFTGPARFQGLAPTGKRIAIEGCDMLRIEDEQIVENNAYTNGAQLAQQLGVLPAEGSVGERAVTAAFNARTAAVDAVRRFRARG